MPKIASLECSRCRRRVAPDLPATVCPVCSGPLYVRYNPEDLIRAARPSCDASPSMWRYAAVLPEATPVTLGEGWTPLLQVRRAPGLRIKQEAANATGSLKARGIAMAVTMARHHGLKRLVVSSTGNDGGALAAYAAAAEIEAYIMMPRDVPMANYMEAKAYGAQVTLVNGLLPECGRMAMERSAKGWFDVSALKEPFRLEGSKTLGYELVEQFGWEYPDAVLYPTGSGTGLIGIWKAFEEMEQMGWVSGRRPKIIAVQATGCAPLSQAWKDNAATAKNVAHASTFAAGLRVPRPMGDAVILEIVRASGGTVVDVNDDEILHSLLDWSRHEGMLLCPEGAAATAAYAQLLAGGFLSSQERTVVINSGSGLKYTETLAEAMRLPQPAVRKYPQRTPVGGIITPQ